MSEWVWSEVQWWVTPTKKRGEFPALFSMLLLLILYLNLAGPLVHKRAQQFDGQGEQNRGVVLHRDFRQRLQIAQLQRTRMTAQNGCRLCQLLRRQLFPLRVD